MIPVICGTHGVWATRAGVADPGRERGQTFVEYAMVLGLTLLTVTVALTFLHDQIDVLYAHITTDFAAVLQ